jgi:hypothetical protein
VEPATYCRLDHQYDGFCQLLDRQHAITRSEKKYIEWPDDGLSDGGSAVRRAARIFAFQSIEEVSLFVPESSEFDATLTFDAIVVVTYAQRRDCINVDGWSFAPNVKARRYSLIGMKDARLVWPRPKGLKGSALLFIVGSTGPKC